ncbi:MAG: hypothetical protein R3C03_23015 [Pirellulaceae bacterium]
MTNRWVFILTVPIIALASIAQALSGHGSLFAQIPQQHIPPSAPNATFQSSIHQTFNSDSQLLNWNSTQLDAFENIDNEQLTTILRQKLSGLTLDAIEQDERLSSLSNALRFAQQASYFSQNRDKQTRIYSLEHATASVEAIASMKQQLEHASIRWPILQDRMAFVLERHQHLQRNVNIAREFVEDDASLAKFIVTIAELKMTSEELASIQFEARLVDQVLRELPAQIAKAEFQIKPQANITPNHQVESVVQAAFENDVTPLTPTTPTLDATISTPELTVTATEPTVDETTELHAKIQQLEQEAGAITRRLKQMHEKEKTLKEKIELIGLSDATALILIETNRSLPDEALLRIQNIETQKAIRANSIRLLDLNDAYSAATESLPPPTNGESYSDSELTTETCQLRDLVRDLHRLHDVLSSVATQRESLLQSSRRIREYLESQLVWVQNSEAIGLRDARLGLEGSTRFLAPQPWYELFTSLVSRIWMRPVETILFVLGFVGLNWGCRRLAIQRPQNRNGEGMR